MHIIFKFFQIFGMGTARYQYDIFLSLKGNNHVSFLAKIFISTFFESVGVSQSYVSKAVKDAKFLTRSVSLCGSGREFGNLSIIL